jgi:hypothetical protein
MEGCYPDYSHIGSLGFWGQTVACSHSFTEVWLPRLPTANNRTTSTDTTSLVRGQFSDMGDNICDLLQREATSRESVWILLVPNTVSNGCEQFVIGLALDFSGSKVGRAQFLSRRGGPASIHPVAGGALHPIRFFALARCTHRYGE